MMEIKKLKNETQNLKMPEDMRRRIAARTETAIMREKTGFRRMRPTLIAAVIVACVCLTAVGVAVGNTGFFRDITRADGAVIGTEYKKATEEIAVSAAADGDILKVEVILLAPERAPYREIEALRIGSYCVADTSGEAVAEGKNTAPVQISGDRAAFEIPLSDIPSGEYVLQIESFTGEKKADQPLLISGAWTCAFDVR